LITTRQLRFLNDLINAKQISNGAVAFDLRFITRPSGDLVDSSEIDIVLLGKVFHPNRNQAQKLCLQLWHKFISHYPLEDPFNYPVEPIQEEDLVNYLTPFETFEHIDQRLLEIRKFEDFDPFSGNELVGYFPHPFDPTFDAAALGRLLETLAKQQQVCVVSVCLQPTELSQQELVAINQMLSRYISIRSASANSSWLDIYRKERHEDIHRAFWPLINQRNHLFKMKIQVIGEQYAPDNLLEALGSELMRYHPSEPRQWSRVSPQNSEDAQIAIYNFSFLEQRPWGEQRIEPLLQRLRSLVSVLEATGAFRLPIPPESGYLPGLEVRDEPFVLPQFRSSGQRKSDLSAQLRMVELGEIFHRGQPSNQFFKLDVSELTRHGLIAGATGSGKTNTCLYLLSQLWKLHKIPFLVMYPIDKPDYRLFMADTGLNNDLLIYTVGDETTSPFRFNPLYVPPGILLKTHMSLLMRCFSAAFSMWDPLPAIYRAALRKLYLDHGWNIDYGKGGDPSVETPTMATFYETLVQIADEMTAGYGDEIKGNIRQGSEIRIRDLLSNAGSVINTEGAGPLNEIITHPTIMELGRIGSPEDTALIMAFLLMQLTEQLQSRFKHASVYERNDYVHITLVEEAHRLMSAGHVSSEDRSDARAQGGEDFASILAEVRGFGEGILIAEQIPTQLVNGAIGNTHLKLMHRLEDQQSFSLFSEVMNLDPRQRDYVRSIKQGYAIVRGEDSRPVHVKIGNYRAHISEYLDDSDATVHAFMQTRQIDIPPFMPWQPPSGFQEEVDSLSNESEDDEQSIIWSEDPEEAAQEIFDQYQIPSQILDLLPKHDSRLADLDAIEDQLRLLIGHCSRFNEVVLFYLKIVNSHLEDIGVPVSKRFRQNVDQQIDNL
jgi:hypothetical protein